MTTDGRTSGRTTRKHYALGLLKQLNGQWSNQMSRKSDHFQGSL